MNIEIIKVQENQQEDPLDPTRSFGIILSKVKSSIQMLHWYSDDYQVHLIFGSLYESLDELFDKLQEEIIGTCKLQGAKFPLFSDNINMNDINPFKGRVAEITNSYHSVSSEMINILTSLEFNNYLNNVKSGINNTKEEILSTFNKTNYLLALINFC